LVFSNLCFEWDPTRAAYRSTGAGELLLVGPHWVNKKMKVYAQISRGRRGDVLNIYIEGSRYNWYYFNYADRKMQVLSSDQGFNEAIDKLKASKRRKGRFEFMLSTMRKKNIFVAEFEDAGGAFDAADEPEETTEERLDTGVGASGETYEGVDWPDEDDWEEAEGTEDGETTGGTAEDGTDEVSAEDDEYDEAYPEDEYWEEDVAE
ncbi:MAG: hypothetical protein K2O01_08975, partial [Bacteroidales bacterium]|nr:hypothetical protein [Bacteroidales bacterium]